jgi:hypothetical protein
MILVRYLTIKFVFYFFFNLNVISELKIFVENQNLISWIFDGVNG